MEKGNRPLSTNEGRQQILRSPLKAQNHSSNPQCHSTLNLSEANQFALSYNGNKTDNSKLCDSCCDVSEKQFNLLANTFLNHEPMICLAVPEPCELITLSDSDQDSDSGKVSGEEGKAIFSELNEDEVNMEVESIITRFDLNYQLQLDIESTNQRVEKLKVECEKMITLYDAVERKFDRARNEFYEAHKPLINELESIEIIDVYQTPQNTEKDEISQGTAASTSDTKEVVALGRVQVVNSNLPPVGPLPCYLLKAGDQVFAMKSDVIDLWHKAVILQVINAGHQRSLYKVKGEKRLGPARLLSGNQLAYFQPSTTRLPVGCRIIAVYHDVSTGQLSNKYYSGIIAEPPKVMNKYRYLVFFDDGYAEYVLHKNIRVIFESSKNVWEDVHLDSKQFIKKYLDFYPERPMVKLQIGQSIKTELNGKWLPSKVTEVDCSLVKMSFSDQHEEWIYRGSTRLWPLYNEQMRQEGKSVHPHRYHRFMDPNKKKNLPYVEYTRGTEEQQDEVASKLLCPCTHNLPAFLLGKKDLEMVSQVAKKQTTTPARAVARKSTGKKVDVSHDLCRTTISGQEGTLVFLYGLVKDPNPVFKPHECSPLCVEESLKILPTIGQTNPLLIPIHLGWVRQIVKLRIGSKKKVCYRAPCGRRLKTIQEVFRYLQITKAPLGIDLYCFDYWVKIFGEFLPQRVKTSVEDLSYGRENMKISCVNCLDNNYPEAVDYSTTRKPTEGVNLNLDPDFLIGCDCEDDCQDKEKCSCWQLTIQGTAYNSDGKINPDVGYEFKRLKESVITGIYECYSRCKCNPKTCLNRVVQHPLQARLQLFKTQHKGWGLRCLNDIPQGTFICVYAGQLLTEQGANEGGKTFGDEYLAELDYIEVIENLKQGYESDVPDEEESAAENCAKKIENSDLENQLHIYEADNSDDVLDDDKSQDSDEEFIPQYIGKRSESKIRTRSQATQPGIRTENDIGFDFKDSPCTASHKDSVLTAGTLGELLVVIWGVVFDLFWLSNASLLRTIVAAAL